MGFQYTYLRFSVTDRCNLNCFYCQPAMRGNFLKESQVLDFQEALVLINKLIMRGIKHVRLTGGEPLLRPDLVKFVRELADSSGLEVLSLTTNGIYLGRLADVLKEGGVQKINISLDTLKKSRFFKLTGCDSFSEVMDSVLKASLAGFKYIKLNCLVMNGFNDDEILDFVKFGLNNNIDVRFIEYFPTHGRCDGAGSMFFSTSRVKKIIELFYGALEFLGADKFAGPAKYFRIKGEASRIGFISSVTDFFCGDCNRLRLTADGRLYPCLHSDYHVDLNAPLRMGDEVLVSDLIERVTCDKRMFNKAFCNRAFEMSSIGG